MFALWERQIVLLGTLCDSLWSFHDGSCYKLHIMRENLTWNEAQDICLNKGATLTSITSKEESQFIHAMTTDEHLSWTYIGQRIKQAL